MRVARSISLLEGHVERTYFDDRRRGREEHLPSAVGVTRDDMELLHGLSATDQDEWLVEVEKNIAVHAPLDLWFWGRADGWQGRAPAGVVEVLVVALFTTRGVKYLRQRPVEYLDCEPVLADPTADLSIEVPEMLLSRLTAAMCRYGTARTPVDALRR